MCAEQGQGKPFSVHHPLLHCSHSSTEACHATPGVLKLLHLSPTGSRANVAAQIGLLQADTLPGSRVNDPQRPSRNCTDQHRSAGGIFTAGQRTGKDRPTLCGLAALCPISSSTRNLRTPSTAGPPAMTKVDRLQGRHTEYLPPLVGALSASPGHWCDARALGRGLLPLLGTKSLVLVLRHLPLAGIIPGTAELTHPSQGTLGPPALLASPLVLNAVKKTWCYTRNFWFAWFQALSLPPSHLAWAF